ncbi:Stress-associated endoplasmic reticulum protein 2 [Gracilariopsis chorda]|uniref:Stress-associated endoplasmic reticulum protein 2 n=1 Tax=Gracilariopsis chorda TaxID=448386 RepID=A0A2V3IH19_9FLOR|nr:Stress-associated endoplasmic reticulum protein 2 [Gracilariopsis chorda]|eukprot:PXF41369.1 Stress-associated endoplasmic reticulum protein 2 [Gracilariopsis chorda]
MPSGNNAARLRKATSRFDKNVTRKVATNSAARKKEDEGYGVGPLLIALFAFVVIGSSLLEVFRPHA